MNALQGYGDDESSDSSNDDDLKDENHVTDSESRDFFNLHNDKYEPTACKMRKVENGDGIEIPESDFWQGSNDQITYLSKDCNDIVQQPGAGSRENSKSHFTHQSILNKAEFSEVRHRKGSTNKTYEKYEMKHFHTESKVQSNEQRKIYYVHSKIAPCLHKKIKNLVPNKLEKKISAHEGVVNKVKWNTSNFSHLFLSASMDMTVKVWNIWSQLDPCLKVLRTHSKAVKDAEWSPCGQKILSCGYDKKAMITDVESGKPVSKFEHSTYVSCGKFNPISPDVIITGGNNCVQAWDCRTPQSPCREYTYKDKYGQVQDILFSNNGSQFYTCNDLVSRDSADRNIMVWDYGTGVVLSNQVYQERYTCTSLKLHPSDGHLLAQSHGNYIALFSTNKPFKMNKSKRFEGHKLSGYKIGFDITPDGSTVYSGSSDGKIYCYNYYTGKQFRQLTTGLDVCMDVDVHPVLPSTLLCCSWNGIIEVWH